MSYDQEQVELSNEISISSYEIDNIQLDMQRDEEDQFITEKCDEPNMIFDNFREACTWSSTNGGKPFKRTEDGFYFTPLQVEDSERNKFKHSHTRLVW